MKKKLIKLGFLGLCLTTLLFGADKIISLGKPPIDEGDKKAPKEDKVKGSTKVTNNVFKSETLSLAKEKGEVYHIIIKKVSQAPLTCKIIREGKELESFSKKKRELVFDIDISQLKVDDNITLTNRKDVTIWEVLVKE